MAAAAAFVTNCTVRIAFIGPTGPWISNCSLRSIRSFANYDAQRYICAKWNGIASKFLINFPAHFVKSIFGLLFHIEFSKLILFVSVGFASLPNWFLVCDDIVRAICRRLFACFYSFHAMHLKICGICAIGNVFDVIQNGLDHSLYGKFFFPLTLVLCGSFYAEHDAKWRYFILWCSLDNFQCGMRTLTEPMKCCSFTEF